MARISIITILCIGITHASDSGNWGYHWGFNFASPEHWKDLPGTSCGGSRQSPIDIIDRQTVFRKELMAINISKVQSVATVSLQTSATSLYLGFSEAWTVTFSGAGCFRPVAIHWHWGSTNRQGSEHKLDSKVYVMEGHLVTFNCGLYKNLNDAAKSTDGVYVFSMLYEIGDMNHVLEKILPLIDIVISNRQASLTEINPTEFLPRDTSKYYQYEGSLTTPPCTENVVWTVFREIQDISTTQIKRFRMLQYGWPEIGPMEDNFRPIMSLTTRSDSSTRIVYSSFKTAIVKYVDRSLCTLVMVIITALLR